MGEPLNHIHQDTKSARLIAVCRRTLSRFSQATNWIDDHCLVLYRLIICNGALFTEDSRWSSINNVDEILMIIAIPSQGSTHEVALKTCRRFPSRRQCLLRA